MSEQNPKEARTEGDGVTVALPRDWKRGQAARFTRAVKALCGTECVYPDCLCWTPLDAEMVISAWEAPGPEYSPTTR
jgi:hypothetical protein